MSDMIDYIQHNIPKMKDLLPITNGIFGNMDYTFQYEITKEQLDLLLYTNIGWRNPAPIVDVVHEDEWEKPFSKLTSTELQKLAATMLAMYKPKWDKLAAVYDLEYDPIHNYLDEWEDEDDGTNAETETVDEDKTDRYNLLESSNSTRTDNLSEQEQRDLASGNTREFKNDDKTEYKSATTHEIDGQNPMKREVEYGKKDLREDDLVRTNTGSETTTTNNTDTSSIWGFNSGSAVNSNQTGSDGSSTRTIDATNPLKEKDTGFQSHTLSGKDSTTDTGKYSDSKSGDDTVKHTGTIEDTGSDTGYVTVSNTGTQSTNGSKGTSGTLAHETDRSRGLNTADHRERSGRHFGNIGNLTSQKMILEEIELWKWSYVNEILEDAKNFLTLQIYI